MTPRKLVRNESMRGGTSGWRKMARRRVGSDCSHHNYQLHGGGTMKKAGIVREPDGQGELHPRNACVFRPAAIDYPEAAGRDAAPFWFTGLESRTMQPLDQPSKTALHRALFLGERSILCSRARFWLCCCGLISLGCLACNRVDRPASDKSAAKRPVILLTGFEPFGKD